MNKIFSKLSFIFLFFNIFSTRAYAQNPPPDINLNPPASVLNPTGVTINSLIGFVLNLLIIAGFVAALAFLIYGGIKWIVSSGEKSKVEAARNQIVAAIVGLIVVVLAWIIINILLNLLVPGGSGITGGFKLPTLTAPPSTPR